MKKVELERAESSSRKPRLKQLNLWHFRDLAQPHDHATQPRQGPTASPTPAPTRVKIEHELCPTPTKTKKE